VIETRGHWKIGGANSCLPVPEAFDHVPQILRERAIISEIRNDGGASWQEHDSADDGAR